MAKIVMHDHVVGKHSNERKFKFGVVANNSEKRIIQACEDFKQQLVKLGCEPILNEVVADIVK